MWVCCCRVECEQFLGTYFPQDISIIKGVAEKQYLRYGCCWLRSPWVLSLLCPFPVSIARGTFDYSTLFTYKAPKNLCGRGGQSRQDNVFIQHSKTSSSSCPSSQPLPGPGCRRQALVQRALQEVCDLKPAGKGPLARTKQQIDAFDPFLTCMKRSPKGLCICSGSNLL